MVKNKQNKNEPSPWKDSRAKELLRKDILDGKFIDSMTAMQIFQMRPEYAPYGLNCDRIGIVYVIP